MAGVSSPTVRRRELGALLRSLRTSAGLTLEQVAEGMLCSPSKVSRLETGERGASAADIRELCRIYGIDDPGERQRLSDLAREGKRQPWWQPFDVPYGTYVGLEAEARSITDFESGVIPGLLQTRGYAQALHEAIVPELTREAIENRCEARMIRQQVLVRDPAPQLIAIMDEAVLHRLVGGEEVMRAQLGRLLEVSKWPNVTIRVLPYRAGAHSALDSTFIYLDFEPPVPAVVYVDGLAGPIYRDHRPEVERYEQVIGQLQALSLSAQDSAELIAGVRSTY